MLRIPGSSQNEGCCCLQAWRMLRNHIQAVGARCFNSAPGCLQMEEFSNNSLFASEWPSQKDLRHRKLVSEASKSPRITSRELQVNVGQAGVHVHRSITRRTLNQSGLHGRWLEKNHYVSVIWTTCSKENLERGFKLQKRAARTTLFADRITPSVYVFNKLRWLSFYEEAKIRRCVLVFNGLIGTLPPYLKDLITVNNEVHSRNTRYSSSNLLCPRYKRETEGSRTFAVISCRLWNSLPLTLRKLETVKLFKYKIWGHFFNEQLILNSFSI